MNEIVDWSIAADPTEQRLKAIKGRFEYNPGEWASVWIAREVSEKHAPLLCAAQDLLAACKKALHLIEENNAEIVEMAGSFGLLADLQAAIAKAEGKSV